MENFAASSFTMLNDSASKVARIQRTMNGGVIHNLQLTRTHADRVFDDIGVSDTDCEEESRQREREKGQIESKGKDEHHFRQDTVFATYIFFSLV